MRAGLSVLALLAALASPGRAVAGSAAVAVGGSGDDEAVAEVSAALSEALAALGEELLPAETVAAAVGTLAEEPAAGTLEGWAAVLEADLLVAAVVRVEESAVTVRVAVFDAGRGVASAAGETGPRSDAGAMAARLLEGLLPTAAGEEETAAGGGAVPEVIEELPDAPPPPPPPARAAPAERSHEGRVQFVLSSTLLGLSLMASVLFTTDVQDPRLFAPILLAGGGGGLGIALVVERAYEISRGDTAVVAAGGFWGGATGLLLAGTSGFPALRWLMTGALAGQVLGLGAGILAAAYTEISAGDGAILHSGALWGLSTGVVLATLVSHEDFRASFGMILAGLVAGLGSGALTARFVEISAGRTAIIDLCGFLGVLLGASVGTPIIIDDQSTGHLRAYAGLVLGAAAAGIGLGVLLTRRWDERPTEPATEPAARPSASRRRGLAALVPVPVPTVLPAAEGVPGAEPAFAIQLVGGLP